MANCGKTSAKTAGSTKIINFVYYSKPLRKCHEKPKNELDKAWHVIITLEDWTFNYEKLWTWFQQKKLCVLKILFSYRKVSISSHGFTLTNSYYIPFFVAFHMTQRNV